MTTPLGSLDQLSFLKSMLEAGDLVATFLVKLKS
jgi:hypothetical protein